MIDPSQRLGANGASEIKKHPWFKGFDWNNLRKRPGPIIPEKKPIQSANMKGIGAAGLNEITTANEACPKMSNEEWTQILKHLNKGDDTGFESHRFDILNETNQRKAEEVK